MTSISRRKLLTGALGASALTLVGPTGAALASSSPRLVRSRLGLTSGFSMGDVSTSNAVFWARSSGEGRLRAQGLRGASCGNGHGAPSVPQRSLSV